MIHPYNVNRRKARRKEEVIDPECKERKTTRGALESRKFGRVQVEDSRIPGNTINRGTRDARKYRERKLVDPLDKTKMISPHTINNRRYRAKRREREMKKMQEAAQIAQNNK